MKLIQKLDDDSLKQRAKEILLQRLSAATQGTLQQLAQTQAAGLSIIWNHPHLTPQEVVDELGPLALAAFQEHAKLTKTIIDMAVSQDIQVIGSRVGGEGFVPLSQVKDPVGEITLGVPGFAFIVNPETASIQITSEPYTP